MTYAEVIRLCIPDADDRLCEHILWGRTPFPMRKVTGMSLYRAAWRWERARQFGITVCEMCDHEAESGEKLCLLCKTALSYARKERHDHSR
jgi:hypothetical protein